MAEREVRLTGNQQGFYTDNMEQKSEPKGSGGGEPKKLTMLIRRPDGQLAPIPPPRPTPPEVLAERAQAQLQYERMMRAAAESTPEAAPRDTDAIVMAIRETGEETSRAIRGLAMQQAEDAAGMQRRLDEQAEEIEALRTRRTSEAESSPVQGKESSRTETEAEKRAREAREEENRLREERRAKHERRKRNGAIKQVGELLDLVVESRDREDLKREHAEALAYFIGFVLKSSDPDSEDSSLELKQETRNRLSVYYNIDFQNKDTAFSEILQAAQNLKEIDVEKFFENIVELEDDDRRPRTDDEVLMYLANDDKRNRRGKMFYPGGEYELFDRKTRKPNITNFISYVKEQLNFEHGNNPNATFDFFGKRFFYAGRTRITFGDLYETPSYFGERKIVISGKEEDDEYQGEEIVDHNEVELYNAMAVGWYRIAYPAQVLYSRSITRRNMENIPGTFDNSMTNSDVSRYIEILTLPMADKDEVQGYIDRIKEGKLGEINRRVWEAEYKAVQVAYDVDDKHMIFVDVDERGEEVNTFKKALGDYDEQKQETTQTGIGVDTFYLELFNGIYSNNSLAKRWYAESLAGVLEDRLPNHPLINKLKSLNEMNLPVTVRATSDYLISYFEKILGDRGGISQIVENLPLLEEVLTSVSKVYMQRIKDEAQKTLPALETEARNEFDEDRKKEIVDNIAGVKKTITAAEIFGVAFLDEPLTGEMRNKIRSVSRDPSRLHRDEALREYAKEYFAMNIAGVIGVKRGDLNPYLTSIDPVRRKIIHNAVVKGAIAASGAKLDEIDTEFITFLSNSFVATTGVPEELDIQGIAVGKARHLQTHRIRIGSGRGDPGFELTIPGIKRFLPLPIETIKFADVGTTNFVYRLRDLIQGGKRGSSFNPRAIVGKKVNEENMESNYGGVYKLGEGFLNFLVKEVSKIDDKLNARLSSDVSTVIPTDEDIQTLLGIFKELRGATETYMPKSFWDATDHTATSRQKYVNDNGKESNVREYVVATTSLLDKSFNTEVIKFFKETGNLTRGIIAYMYSKLYEAHTSPQVREHMFTTVWIPERAGGYIKEIFKRAKVKGVIKTTSYGTEIYSGTDQFVSDRVAEMIVTLPNTTSQQPLRPAQSQGRAGWFR